MARIQINNPRQIINGGAKKYYFKVKGLGGPKGDKGDKGDTGQTGPQGPQGNAATVSVGSTTTLPVGYDATVTNSGSIYNAVLDFGIPQGPQGPQGAKGDKGDTGAKGDTGLRGPQGERGTNATVYVGTTTTTNPGTQARVYNSGTDSNAVLNFEIPRGDVGPQPELVQTTGTSTTKAMSQNATTNAINSGLATKQDTLTAGDNVQINGTTISATDTTYTAGNGLNLNGTELSADTTVLATKTDLDGYYTKPETDNLLAPKLEAEVVAELPTTGEEGKLYLTPKAHTTSTATGNPITATVTEDAGKIESFQLDGDTFQQSYNGSNLIDMPIVSGSRNGVTWVVNPDGSITLNGTATANVGIRAEGARIPAVAGETYTLSATGLQNIVNFGYKNDGSGADILVVTPDSPVKTVQITEEMLTSANRLDMFFAAGKSFNNQRVTLQLEKGSTATAYEPYVGGQPSPNPEYPQAIQTVTGTQTVEIVGKNMFDISEANMMVARLNSSGGITLDITNRLCTNGYIRVKPSTTYTFNALPETSGKTLQAYIVGYSESGSGTSIGNYPTNAWYSFPITFTTGSNCRFIRISYRYSDDSSMATTSATNQQLELGSTATTYVPYSSTDYPISLGDIELCKLGTYQDYIYKDGEDWKVHKELGDVTLDSTYYNSRYGTNSYGLTQFLVELGVSDYYDVSGYVTMLSNSFTKQTTSFSNTQVQGFLPALDSNSHKLRAWIRISTTTADTTGQFKAWLNTNTPIFYYKLDTPTDTVITDTTLIAQLEAIRTASLENGANTITNTAAGSNLAGDMEIGYYGYNPRNRYDKWLWLDIDNEYEQIGS